MRRLTSCLLAAGSLALAGPPASPGISWAEGPVGLRAQVILASNQPGPGGAGSDARLGALIGELRKVFGYSRYELLETLQGSAGLNQPWRPALPGGRALEVTPTAVRAGQVSLQVRVLGPGGEQLMASTVTLRGGQTILVGGPPHQSGVLIIALSGSVP